MPEPARYTLQEHTSEYQYRTKQLWRLYRQDGRRSTDTTLVGMFFDEVAAKLTCELLNKHDWRVPHEEGWHA